MIRVSVIMPFLNLEKFIEESIESVVAQTYDAWELILVDDGSTDRSTEIARRYAARHPGRIRYYEHSGHVNRGASASRNVGLARASGELVAFLDGDDVWLPGKLEEQVALLDAMPEAGAVYGHTLCWYSWSGRSDDQSRDYLLKPGVPKNSLIDAPDLLIKCLRRRAIPPATCSLLVRRPYVDAAGGFEEDFRQVFTDQAFYAKLLLRTPVYLADACWDKYRQHPESACAVAARNGEIEARRRAYLEWVVAYLGTQQTQSTLAWVEARKELWRYEHPRLSKPIWYMERLWRRVRRVFHRVARARQASLS